jgi:hypothetical protein
MDAVAKPTGKLPPEAQRLLRTFYVLRPDVDLPPHLLERDGTWGRFVGDGRPEREIQVGFRPAFVLFTVPLYPNGAPVWLPNKKEPEKGQFVDPGIHDQPPTTESGFICPATCNKMGDSSFYIVWKGGVAPAPAPEKPAAEENESPRDRRRREQMEKRQKALDERKARAAARRR